ncbi:cystinosin [Pochonia chlamydosporia 170]|uniref:Cystinosin n=1 Tax=Pochonia chlamydosporia 170 TaxID=1380566 RepID=A0A179F4S5_METCM|nr:cystinosin [Pochonia chlamydosporia 170]OAQ60426.1 cystinosin [Pochonia chlamydosporia 170]
MDDDSTTMPKGVAIFSAIIGWAYTFLWTVSFYPLLISNIRRRSTHGVSVDFCLLNLLGMTAYAIYNITMRFSPVVRRQYAARNPQNPTPIVQSNDVAYALHGLFISATIYSQFYPRLWGFDTAKPSRISPWCSLVFWGCIIAALVGAFVAILVPYSQSWMWLDVIYLVGNIKTFLTLLKYIPQTWLNYKRKSTQGLPLLPFALDIAGASLSLLQLLIDSAYSSNQPTALSNPVKLLLAYVTICFDLVFFFQHYVLYRNATDDDLLGGRHADEEDHRLLETELR